MNAFLGAMNFPFMHTSAAPQESPYVAFFILRRDDSSPGSLLYVIDLTQAAATATVQYTTALLSVPLSLSSSSSSGLM